MPVLLLVLVLLRLHNDKYQCLGLDISILVMGDASDINGYDRKI